MSRPPPGPLFVLRGSKGAVNSICFTNGVNNLLLSGCSAGEVRIWDLKSRRTRESVVGHSSQGILHVTWYRSGKFLSHGRDGNVNIWDTGNGSANITSSIPVYSKSFCKFSLLQKDQKTILAVAGDDMSEVKVHDLRAEGNVYTLVPSSCNGPVGMPMALNLVSETQLIAGYEDGSILEWDLREKKVKSKVKSHKEPVMCLDYSTNLLKGFSGSAENTLSSWVLGEDGLQISNTVELMNDGFSDVKVRGDGRILATGGWDSKIRIFGCKKLKHLAILSYHTGSIHSLDFSQPMELFGSQYFLAAGSKDKHISVWSIYNSLNG